MESQEPLALLDSAGNRLQAQKQQIYEEIRNYPRPIAACDLQFNHLLEERARVADELNRIHEERQQVLTAKPSTSSPSAERIQTD